MSRITLLDPVFVDRMPAELAPGVLYISHEYHVTKHLCPCGCAEVVTLPLHPEQWQYTYDGKTVSMHPSVGNVGAPCNSHYWIVTGRISWAKTITASQAQHGWDRDHHDLHTYDANTEAGATAAAPRTRKPLWKRLRFWS